MMASARNQPRTEEGTFSYFQLQPRHEHEKPYEILIDLPEEAKHVPRSNLAFEDASCSVKDVRGNEGDFHLNTHGFAWRQLETSVDDFRDRDKIEEIYLAEVENYIKSFLGETVKRIKVFDWRVFDTFCPLQVLISGNRKTDSERTA